MTEYSIPDNLPPGVSGDFTHPCNVCGSTVTVAACEEQPHRCRIDLDAQRQAYLDQAAHYEARARYWRGKDSA